jgi:transcription initiation factor TFIIIB Brf1 subunit/transcription initiation factor TFIIB
MIKCPLCSGTAVSPDGPKGEKVCQNCGLVINNKLIVPKFDKWKPEWHSNWNQDDPETLKEWLTILKIISCQLKISRFPYQEEAALKIRKSKTIFLQSQRFAKNKRATIAALIHLVLKEYNHIRPIKGICEELGLDTQSVLKQVWTIKSINTKKEILKIKRKTSKDYLFEFANKITHNSTTLNLAHEALKNIQYTGGNPISLAAGALYHASKKNKEHLTKNQIGKIFHISPRTVDTNERKIRNYLMISPNKSTQIMKKIASIQRTF